MTCRVALLIAAAVLGSVLRAAAADVYVYPAKGQSKDKQQRDEYECYQWAKQQTGVDPSRPQAQTAVPAPAPRGQMVGGAARGAAVGAVGGAIGGNAGKGAAVGAGVGATAGAIRRHGARRAAASGQQQANQQSAASRDAYNRAYAACMSGRGYTVK